jgi:hypothetical protein
VRPHSDLAESVISIPTETLQAAPKLWGQAGEVHYIPLCCTSQLPSLRDGDQVLAAHKRDQV